MPLSRTPQTLGVGMIGYAFMGAAHSQAWRSAPRFFDLPVRLRMSVLAGRNEARAKAAADKYGWDDVETDWIRLVDRDDVDIVDICTPGDTHAEMAITALEAGKHVLCEKPLANSVAEAEAMAAAARRAASRGVRATCGFTYRRVPAARLMADLVAAGVIGTLRHIRASYLQDWLIDPATPMSWRLEKQRAGSGALGDIGAHAIDLAQYITGDPITGVTALSSTFVPRRPIRPQTASSAQTPPPAANTARSRWTTPPCSSPAPPPAPWPPSKPLGSPPGTRTACGSNSTVRPDRSSSTWSG